MTIKTFEVIKPWIVTEKRSPWFGEHHSGMVQIPSDEFTAEQWAELTEGENAVLKFVSEKEAEAPAVAGEGEQTTMSADTGEHGSEGSEV